MTDTSRSTGGPAPRNLAPGLWWMPFPLKFPGMDVGRNVTLLGLPSGGLVIHSTAPFDADAVAAIRSVGRPMALVEASCLHDTYAVEGSAAFPEVPYFVPERFPARKVRPTRPIAELERMCGDALRFRKLEGMPRVNEHVCFHPASRTLVLADLCFNYTVPLPTIGRWFLRYAAGIRAYPGNSRVFRLLIRDRDAFERSLADVFEWDFERVLFGHGTPLENDAKPVLREALGKFFGAANGQR